MLKLKLSSFCPRCLLHLLCQTNHGGVPFEHPLSLLADSHLPNVDEALNQHRIIKTWRFAGGVLHNSCS